MFLQILRQIKKIFIESLKDLLPIVCVIGFFQLIVLKEPIDDFYQLFIGLLFVVVGLSFFVFGLELGLFPLGEYVAYTLAQKGSIFWLFVFSFGLGFGTTIAEPALVAVAQEAAKIASSSGLIEPGIDLQRNYALGLRLSVALAVGFAIVIGVLRILKGWPVQYVILIGYCLVVILTFFAPKEIIGIAYDSGGVTTSTITVPLVTVLGVGLASSIKGRNPMIDGFGLIALASLFPIIFVMCYGIIFS